MTHFYDIAIVGAGFCGTLTAIHLAKLLPSAKIVLIERNEVHGHGLAYGTVDPDHLLNVRAGQMGAFPDDIGHFHKWLQANGYAYTPLDFVPRTIYGKYLTALLQESRAAHTGLSLLQKHIIDIRRMNDAFELIAADDGRLMVHKVILALGNFPPDPLDNSAGLNPYTPQVWHEIADDGDVLLIGTGLTSLDLVVTLAKTKKAGIVHLLSRHGFLPREHASTQPYTLSFDATDLPATARGLLRAVRHEIVLAAKNGISWHSVIDALRPHNQHLWQSFNDKEKRRFQRHLRAYWDVHRHRCAPEVMDAYRKLEHRGRLQLHHGPLISRTSTDAGWHVKWRPRGHNEIQEFDVRHIVSCTGPQADFRKLADPLVQNLLRNKLISPDALSLGIATTDTHEALNEDQKTTFGLYALGSMLKGRLYESVAVPELRVQAAAVAALVGKEMPHAQT